MPACWPFDERSNPHENEKNVIMLDIDLLTMKKTLQEIKGIVETEKVCSVPGVTFMSALSDAKVYWCENRDWSNINKISFYK